LLEPDGQRLELLLRLRVVVQILECFRGAFHRFDVATQLLQTSTNLRRAGPVASPRRATAMFRHVLLELANGPSFSFRQIEPMCSRRRRQRKDGPDVARSDVLEFRLGRGLTAELTHGRAHCDAIIQR
jgi:hypothetical protein